MRVGLRPPVHVYAQSETVNEISGVKWDVLWGPYLTTVCSSNNGILEIIHLKSEDSAFIQKSWITSTARLKVSVSQ